MDVFEAIADPTRRRIIELVAASPRGAGEVAQQFSISRPAVSQQLTALVSCGILHVSAQGRSRIYTLNEKTLTEPHDWLEQQRLRWNSALNRLESEMQREEENTDD